LAKYIPFSFVVMTIVLPFLFARRPNPKRSLRVMQGFMFGYILLWAYMCLYVYTQYVFIE
jgi:hypothetical protein